MEFRKDLLTNEYLIVWCKTEEEANELSKWAIQNGKKWFEKQDKWEEASWFRFKAKTCYSVAMEIKGSLYGFESWDDVEILTFDQAIQTFKNVFNDIAKKRGDGNL